MALTEREQLTVEMDCLRQVLVSPERYWRRRHQPVDVAGLVAEGRALEAEWGGAWDDEAMGALRREIRPTLRGLGFDLPEGDVPLDAIAPLDPRSSERALWLAGFESRVRRGLGDRLHLLERSLRATADGIAAARQSFAASAPDEGPPRVIVRYEVADRPLDSDQIHRLAVIAATCGLDRDLLLHEHEETVVRLDDKTNRLAQHKADIIRLNQIARDVAYSVALRSWLREAVRLLGPRSEREEVEALLAGVERWIVARKVAGPG